MWDKDEILQNLYNDYITHYWRIKHFERNNDDVLKENELAICEYILEKIATYENERTIDIYKKIDNVIQGVFVFDPQNDLRDFIVKAGFDYYASEDIFYSDYETFVDVFGEEIDYLFEKIFSVNKDVRCVYIPKGTKMTYKEYDEKSRTAVFIIHGEEFAFREPSFKLKPAK